ncbi:MAG TPA: glucodextranase DOMON-like domain-containing protein [Thermoanaerobaculia bacterium]|nr:glucodextranase DOMON-like domain-containing protein [Thermoanaerobaculia bacterium]
MNSSRRLQPALLALLLATILPAVPAAAAKKPIFTLTDPRGDDHGDGNLIYPGNRRLEPGELDILSLEAFDEGNGTRFEVTFAKPVKKPQREAIDDLGTQLTDVARYGFYNLNLDIYIDTDRVPGSGGVSMLPGRQAEIDPATAWEKAIILTPRPNEAKSELQRMLLRTLNEDSRRSDELKDEEIEALKKQVPLDIESRIFFPTQVRVLGQKISFFVPALFLGGIAKPTWAYVVASSGCDLLQQYDPSRAILSRKEELKSLMIMPVSPGNWQDRFGGGRENAANQPPLMDIIVPKGKKQETILSDFSGREKRPVVIPGVVPAEQ